MESYLAKLTQPGTGAYAIKRAAQFHVSTKKDFGGSALSCITQQAQYDLWQAMQKADEIKVKAFASL